MLRCESNFIGSSTVACGRERRSGYAGLGLVFAVAVGRETKHPAAGLDHDFIYLCPDNLPARKPPIERALPRYPNYFAE